VSRLIAYVFKYLTVSRLFLDGLERSKEVIYQDSIKDLKPLSREIEMDETMFGGKRPGKCGWGASGKNIVFGIYQRNLESAYFSYLFRG